MNTLRKLLEHGQSYWLDNLTRSMIRTGELKRKIANDGLRGITSNPAIFQKAIGSGKEYDSQIRRLSSEGLTLPRIYENLVVTDTREACDVLRPVFDASEGADGFVSLEVSPHLAFSTEQTVAEARRLWNAVDRPNLMIKIPGTQEGLPAVEQALYDDCNINVTLLFSVANYEQAAEAFLTALERRVSEGRTVRNVASVACFFVSRIDTVVDVLLGERWTRARSVEERARVAELFGRAAIANARLAYGAFRRITASERWERLREKGARPQRLLWASTSTKDPLYYDVRYVESLIGRDTVNTMPEQTAEAFAQHGKIYPGSVEADAEGTRETFSQLAELGLDFDRVTAELQEDGVRKFIEPFDSLMVSLAGKRRHFLGKKLNRQHLSDSSQATIKSAIQALDVRRFVTRLYARDGTLWSLEAALAAQIQKRLGWLDSPSDFLEKVGEIQAVAESVRREGFKHTVILGMGGSSLCPEVFSRTFGAGRGWPELVVLDNTDPYAIAHLLSQIEPTRSLFVIASKSGSTIETISFYRYFYDLAGRSGVTGRSFLAITDPGTWLAKEAAAKRFRHCFLNPPDIPGRYSALSYFGLVPMALMGINIKTFLERATKLQISSGPGLPAAGNPPVELGTLAALEAKRGRDKLTFIISDTIGALGEWLEQLLAESTGKQGRGLIPVIGEPVGSPRAYGKDRLFIYISHAAADNKRYDKRVAALEKAGHPVVRVSLPDRMGLAEEFLRWELATATAASILRVNPFDEPNVGETTRNTTDLLNEWQQKGKFGVRKPAAGNVDFSVYGGASSGKPSSPEKLIRSFLDSVRPGDYLALLPYFRKTPPRDRLLQQMRVGLRDRTKVATILAYGPRYLHTTGQMHKGGPNSGVFLLVTSDAEENLPIPGQEYDFATLQQAQALADFAALEQQGRRVLRIHFHTELKPGLKRLAELVG